VQCQCWWLSHGGDSQTEDGDLDLQGLNQAVLIVVHLCKHLRNIKHAQQSIVSKWDAQGGSIHQVTISWW